MRGIDSGTGSRNPARPVKPVAFLLPIAVVLGIALRHYQFDSQILFDDEWHAVHQLMLHQPKDFLLSFGVSDYCIPLTLLYWTEAALLGLSEWGMRWPMLICGIATLVLLPLYVWRALGPRHAILFGFLLAISPALVLYSRIARPYAVTLLLVYMAHFAFDRHCNGSRYRRAFGAGYGLCAILAAWMHLVVGALVAAPFLYQIYVLWHDDKARRMARLRSLFLLGLITLSGMALVILPPLLADASAIAAKSGADSPTLETIQGVWYWWIGTGSTTVVVSSLLLAAIGFPDLWRSLPIVRTLSVGLLLTVAILLLLRPAWVQNPVTFGRYLLPVIPLLLLAVAAGTVRLANLAQRAPPAIARVLAMAILGFPALALAAQSPLRDIFYYPNSNIADPYFYFDFRPAHNPFPGIFKRYAPLSAFWSQLPAAAPGSLRIAGAPFNFESISWDAPRWERIGRQRVVPAYLSGLCIDKRFGEPPRDARFRFRNAVFLADESELVRKKIDMISFQKPYVVTLDDGRKIFIGEETRQCEGALRTRFGSPTYEDDKLVVFTLKKPGHAE